ncbi:selenide, water dikinase SelD [Thermoflavifilum thermophilum]|uniref:Selenide, water dikinase n=1 Tax=Thermoflavifilum thermophilum TaxID=1393122 RepID=A0A1I7NAG2_9BACT|nr:selenide, water dikinase SelD [Thermoflavifilum thermophilum]SFV31650.1 selenophosphate synthase [Thermoflavifilum thermophilum]
MDNPSTTAFRLTQYAHGAGCGCKISPAVLEQILHRSGPQSMFPGLLVGYEHRDDAAVLDLGNGQALIATTDFFMPIVDDAYDFGRIAATNALSDVYAMGGEPVMALAILGWPVNKLPASLAHEVIEGARAICHEARIPLAGGHSIDAPEPIFGLCVNGMAPLAHIRRNNTVQAGNIIFLTKPIGIGILTTAQKKGLLRTDHQALATKWMTTLNKAGSWLGTQPAVTAMTDVTGFGLLGHLLEMVDGSDCSAILDIARVPLLTEALWDYISAGAVPGGTQRNWDSYGHLVSLANMQWMPLLADPQTSGGLLFTVKPDAAAALIHELKLVFPEMIPYEIGQIIKMGEKSVIVR